MQYLWNKCQQSGHKYIENYRILKKYSKDKIFHNLLGNNNSKVKCLTFGLPIGLSCSPILEKNSIVQFVMLRIVDIYIRVQYGQIRRMYAFFLDKNRFIILALDKLIILGITMLDCMIQEISFLLNI